MTKKFIVPYGRWESELSVADVTAGSKSLTSPRPVTNRAFFVESRNDGTNGILEVCGDHARPVLPESHDADTIVYEYGGLPYTVIPDNPPRIIFSDSKSRSVKVLEPDTGKVEEVLLRSATLRYADFDANPLMCSGEEKHQWVLAVEEDHIDPTPSEVRNYVVAINPATKEVKRIVEGADFYSYPRFSPDGTKISWLEWDHPDLPFMGVKLFWADWQTEGNVMNKSLVAGTKGQSVAEPNWSPDNRLYFTQERGEFRQIFSRATAEPEAAPLILRGLEDAEFGDASFRIGCQSYIFLSAEIMIAAPVVYGQYQLVHINITTGDWTRLDVPSGNLRGDIITQLSSTSFLMIGSGLTTPSIAARVSITDGFTTKLTLIRESVDKTYPESLFSSPEHIAFTAHKGYERSVHGFYWPPHNPKYVAPPGELPPLIIMPHGGPTGHTSPGLALDPVQFYTSRGYAFVAINYTGSSGHGKQYRESLFGRWGIVDTDDVAEMVAYLAQQGRIDGRRVGIQGGSAGGYNVLNSLCFYPDTYAAGICICGVSDVKALTVGTHKMESRYMEVLMDVVGKSPEEQNKVYEERSPLNFADKIKAPLLLIHGEDDPVVPIEQSRQVMGKIQERGGTAKLISVPGEGHGFHKASSLELYVRESEAWWAKTLLEIDS